MGSDNESVYHQHNCSNVSVFVAIPLLEDIEGIETAVSSESAAVASRRRRPKQKEPFMECVLLWILLGMIVIVVCIPFIVLDAAMRWDSDFVAERRHRDAYQPERSTNFIKQVPTYYFDVPEYNNHNLLRITQFHEEHDENINRSLVHPLTKDNFWQFLNNHENTFVMFGRKWIVPCQQMVPVWGQFAQVVASSDAAAAAAAISKKHVMIPNVVHVGSVECTAQSDLCQQEGILWYPTLRWFQHSRGGGGSGGSGSGGSGSGSDDITPLSPSLERSDCLGCRTVEGLLNFTKMQLHLDEYSNVGVAVDKNPTQWTNSDRLIVGDQQQQDWCIGIGHVNERDNNIIMINHGKYIICVNGRSGI